MTSFFSQNQAGKGGTNRAYAQCNNFLIHSLLITCLQHFDTVGWASGGTPGM